MEVVVDIVSTELAAAPDERVIVTGVKLTVSPAGTETERVTVPAKPLRLVSVAVVVADVPSTTLRLFGLALTEKSGGGGALTVTEIATE